MIMSSSYGKKPHNFRNSIQYCVTTKLMDADMNRFSCQEKFKRRRNCLTKRDVRGLIRILATGNACLGPRNHCRINWLPAATVIKAREISICTKTLRVKRLCALITLISEQILRELTSLYAKSLFYLSYYENWGPENHCNAQRPRFLRNFGYFLLKYLQPQSRLLSQHTRCC